MSGRKESPASWERGVTNSAGESVGAGCRVVSLFRYNLKGLFFFF